MATSFALPDPMGCLAIPERLSVPPEGEDLFRTILECFSDCAYWYRPAAKCSTSRRPVKR